MKFNSLSIANFLTVQCANVFLADRGLNLLQGINEVDSSATSNGAGKSTIADALCWALYGTTARGASSDQVINNVAKKNTAVAVDLQDGATGYRITRYRKHATFKNSTTVLQMDSAGAIVDLTKGTEKETQAVINQILGCSLEVFKGAIYAGQENMVDLPGQTDKALKVLIEEAAGVEQLEAAYGVARTKAAEAEKGVGAIQARIDSAQMYIGHESSSKQIAELKHADFEQGREGRAKGFSDQADAQKQAALAILATIKGIDHAALEQERDALVAATQGAQAATQAAAKYFNSTVQSATIGVDRQTRQFETAAAEAREIAKTIENAPAELAKPCSACGKPHTPDELESFKAHQTVLLRTKLSAANELKAARDAAQATLAAARAEHARLLSLIPDVSATVTRINDLNKQIAEVTAMKAEVARIIGVAQGLVAQAEMARKEVNPQAAVIEQCEKRIAERSKEIADLQPQLAEAKRVMEIAQSVAQVFSPAGVRAHILDTVTPFLNERTSHYLGNLSDGNLTAIWSTLTRNAKGEAREKFGIEVSHALGGEDFCLISGGEKRKVRLACMLALQDLVASRATKSIELWIGDEIDDAMDEAGLERLMAILEEKAREKGTVVVISHNSLRDWIDETTVMRKVAKGHSVIEGGLTVAA